MKKLGMGPFSGWAGVLALAAAFLCSAVVASAAVEGKLSGRYAVKVGAVEASFPVSTDKVSRTYGFKCKNKKCSKVEFEREGGDGTYTSTLRRSGRGTFEGVESTAGDDCPDSDGSSDRTLAHTVKILKVNAKGKATKIAGESDYSWPDCPGGPTQTTAFTGKPK